MVSVMVERHEEQGKTVVIEEYMIEKKCHNIRIRDIL